MAIKRIYGKERNLGDILYNKNKNTVFTKLNLGFYGTKTVTLLKRGDGCYDLMITIKKDDEAIPVKIGQTFPVKKKNGTVVEGMSQTTLGLLNEYDKDKKKDVIKNEDALVITTHKLKEPKELKKGFIKVGYITGKIAIEQPDKKEQTETQQSNQTYQPSDDEIPF